MHELGFELGLVSAHKLDAEDDLASFREAFVFSGPALIYPDGNLLAPLGFTLGSPQDPARWGSHVSVRHPEDYRITQALIEDMTVLPDFREPDNVRLGPAPLYTSFVEVGQAVDRIRRVVEEKSHLRYPAERLPVT